MTITELKQLLERAEKMGYGSGKVTLVERNAGFYSTTYVTREVSGAHLTRLGTNLLDETANPECDDYELRLDLNRGE